MINELLNDTKQFSFVQVMRLLRYYEGGDEANLEKILRIRPKLSLGFPSADLACLDRAEENAPEKFRLTANFLGLYGTSSPLPTFYTEDLFEEARGDESVSREFFDFINNPLYHLFFGCMSKYRYDRKIGEERDELTLEILYSILGLGDVEIRNDVDRPYRLLRYTGLFTQFPRSALGLKTLLADALDEKTVDIDPCVERTAHIPRDQQCALGMGGCSVGEDTFLGDRVADPLGKIRIRVGPLPRKRFGKFLPETALYNDACFLTRHYLLDPLECDLEVQLKPGEVEQTQLGGDEWAKLGWNTWVFSGDLNEELSATFRV